MYKSYLPCGDLIRAPACVPVVKGEYFARPIGWRSVGKHPNTNRPPPPIVSNASPAKDQRAPDILGAHRSRSGRLAIRPNGIASR